MYSSLSILRTRNSVSFAAGAKATINLIKTDDADVCEFLHGLFLPLSLLPTLVLSYSARATVLFLSISFVSYRLEQQNWSSEND